ncbi:DUF5133 domain-containing protein [Streptomyces solincola]|uniref:DUF5133 domain-containing protein n=1 Tax=Streptomyces solincola TaxID=2100817 RepID=A0A2S9PUQ8_9ACTN|nr:DUF5133 domain-containing protein [Streptomyces solincola]PRH78156.1 DUF5133 domain-containing protein [Streptomyces solincola]
MLLAHPAVLRELVARYESLCTAAQGLALAPDLQRRLDDVTYTLCVTTGTRDLDHALAAARARLTATASAVVAAKDACVVAAAKDACVAAAPLASASVARGGF